MQRREIELIDKSYLSLKIIIENFGVTFVFAPHASSFHRFKRLALLEYKKTAKEKRRTKHLQAKHTFNP
jgi:hypothetical protein